MGISGNSIATNFENRVTNSSVKAHFLADHRGPRESGVCPVVI